MQHDTITPEMVVQRQLDAYNAHDLAGWLATYAQDAVQYQFPDTVLASGIDAIADRAASRFAEPNLHAALKHRTVCGNVVIDSEDVIRTFPEGPGRMAMVAIYQVVEGRIKTASFVFGDKVLD
ncbi:nuclear transport factor 2 family protein [Chitinolyticbacter albus]|uniref:nuclear transport factor 2 family protein n=1 Tax=Chitinolyticbacter albus TaxID=2961951 RepID=UPI00210B63E9|nr:nuclear transport factor 2 family protein [Chitinolyticbacter albus]